MSRYGNDQTATSDRAFGFCQLVYIDGNYRVAAFFEFGARSWKIVGVDNFSVDRQTICGEGFFRVHFDPVEILEVWVVVK